jgi:DNA-binding transcriptional ArsR family regulator
MKCPSYNLFFETIATKIRMNILWLLRIKPMSVTEICKALNEEQSKISHNLRKLVACRVVQVEKKGKQRIYHLNKDTIVPILDLVEQHVQKHCGKACQKIK